MLPENVNWNAVLQSITDTWLPLIGMVAAIILVAIIVHVIQKNKSKTPAARRQKKKAVVQQKNFNTPILNRWLLSNQSRRFFLSAK